MVELMLLLQSCRVAMIGYVSVQTVMCYGRTVADTVATDGCRCIGTGGGLWDIQMVCR